MSEEDDAQSEENSNDESSQKQQIVQSTNSKKSVLKGKKIEKTEGKKRTAKSVRWKDDVDENEADISSNNECDTEFFCEDGSDSEKNISVDKTQVLKEDIYGRVHDGSGNLVNDSNSRMPSALRANLSSIDDKQKEKLERLRRQLKGLVNR